MPNKARNMLNKAAATAASIKRKKKEDKEGSIRSRITAYTCSCHPTIYCCKAGLGTCWLEHLADCGDEFIDSDQEGENIDGGVDFEL
jgi:hypothetical protein